MKVLTFKKMSLVQIILVQIKIEVILVEIILVEKDYINNIRSSYKEKKNLKKEY